MDDSSIIVQLIQKIAKDDEQAFAKFYDHFYSTIYRFTTYFVQCEDINREIVSDVFFNIWQSRKKLPEVENIRAYLYSAARNRAIYYLKQRKVYPVTETDNIPITIVTDNETPENILLNNELKKKIRESVEMLPEKCRLIFLMAKIEGLKYREIARILSISKKTVNAQMVIALKKLGKSIGDYLSAMT